MTLTVYEYVLILAPNSKVTFIFRLPRDEKTELMDFLAIYSYPVEMIKFSKSLASLHSLISFDFNFE